MTANLIGKVVDTTTTNTNTLENTPEKDSSSTTDAANSTASSESNNKIDWEAKFTSLDKRFRDNQSFTQKKTNDLEAENKELQSALTESKKAKLPSSEEDLKALAQENPKLVDAMQRMIGEHSLAAKQEMEEKMKVLEKAQSDLKLEKQYTKLLEAHPDVEDIKASDEFKDWLDVQDGDIKSIPYNEKASVGMLTLLFNKYKADSKAFDTASKAKSDTKSKQVNDSLSSKSSKTPILDTDSEMIKSSDIMNMSRTEWNKHKAKIQEMASKGLVITDT